MEREVELISQKIFDLRDTRYEVVFALMHEDKIIYVPPIVTTV